MNDFIFITWQIVFVLVYIYYKLLLFYVCCVFALHFVFCKYFLILENLDLR